jgi:hypothetical protein
MPAGTVTACQGSKVSEFPPGTATLTHCSANASVPAGAFVADTADGFAKPAARWLPRGLPMRRSRSKQRSGCAKRRDEAQGLPRRLCNLFHCLIGATPELIVAQAGTSTAVAAYTVKCSACPQVLDRHWEVLHDSWSVRSSRSCKSLILKRRDVRVVEGARLEIVLTVCDGVLQISITVADPES